MGTKKYGYSVMEILVAIGIFAIIIGSVSIFSIDSYRSTLNVQNKINAASYLQEMSTALELNAQQMWSTISQNTNTGAKHLVFLNNTYQLANGTTTKGNITLSMSISPVSRDASGNIVQTGGTDDVHTRSVTMTASWTDFTGAARNLTTTTYVNDWSTFTWQQTSQADFDSGTKTNVVSTNYSGGEVQLGGLSYPDWCAPDKTIRGFDLIGQGVGTSLSAIQGRAYVGTGSNSSGYTFAKITLSDAQPPVPATEGVFDGYKANSIWGDNTNVVIGTDSNGKEVVILDITKLPYTEIGYFDAAGSNDGASVAVSGNTGFVIIGNTLRSFDLTVKTGSRPQRGAYTLPATGTSLTIFGNYAFVSIANGINQLEIVNITNPAAMTKAGYADLPNGGIGRQVVLNTAGNRAYIATSQNSLSPEVWVIDVSSTTGKRPVVSSYETNGMDPKGITQIDDKILVAGNGGTQYQVINIANENAPVYCGGLVFNSGILAVTSVKEADGDAYSYVLTNDSSSEFKIIRGGPGAGPGAGNYPASGTFISQIFDTQNTATALTSLEWSHNQPSGTSIRIQVKSGNTLTELSSNSWVGPNGSSTTYFTSNNGSSIPVTPQGKRYVQFRAELLSSTGGAATPVLQSLNINYQR